MISSRPGLGALIRRGAKPIALFGVVLILAAQFMAVTHFHQTNRTRQFNSHTQVVADDGLCALCNLAFHAPVNPATIPAFESPLVDIQMIDGAIVRPRSSDSHALC
jgi:hypothetical protein